MVVALRDDGRSLVHEYVSRAVDGYDRSQGRGHDWTRALRFDQE